MANRPNWNQSGDERDRFEEDDVRGLAEDEADEPSGELEGGDLFNDEDDEENETEDQ